MPNPARLGSALQQASPPSRFRSALEEAIAQSSAQGGPAYCDSDDSDTADEEAERILAEHRARREAEEAKKAEERAAEMEAIEEAGGAETFAHLGFAGRMAAMKRAAAKIAAAKGNKLQAIADAAAAAARLKITVCAHVLTDPDMLFVILKTFETLHLGDVPTEGGLQRYTALAGVCTQWREALLPVLKARCALRHAHMFYDGPRHVIGFNRPSFLEITTTDQLLVADNHRVSLLPCPPADEASEGAPGVLSAKLNQADIVIRTFGKSDGSGGSERGDLYHPHGLALSSDSEILWVSDRSNHRIQSFRVIDGTPLACTPSNLVYGPYDIALYHGKGPLVLYISDANNDRILALNARAMDTAPLGSFGNGSGSAPGQLDRPRGLSVAGAELCVAELGNNRVSVFNHDGKFLRTIGSEASENGALPLRQPFGVHHAHGLLLVSEFSTFGRLCVFTPQGAPLQVLCPKTCGGLGGITSDAHWIYVLDAEKGHVLAFTPKQPAPLGSRPLLRPPPSTVPSVQRGSQAQRAGISKAIAIASAKGQDVRAVVNPNGGNGKETGAGASGVDGSGGDSDEGEGGGSSSSAGTAQGGEAVLIEWVHAHSEDPVPGFSEKKTLAAKTGMSLKEVSAWFVKHKSESRANEAAAAEAAESDRQAAKGPDAKTLAMAQRLAESLGGFSDGSINYRQMSVNMSEY